MVKSFKHHSHGVYRAKQHAPMGTRYLNTKHKCQKPLCSFLLKAWHLVTFFHSYGRGGWPFAFAFAFRHSYAIWWTNSKEQQHEHLFSCFFRISQLLINSKNVILMPFSHSDANPAEKQRRIHRNKANKTSLF